MVGIIRNNSWFIERESNEVVFKDHDTRLMVYNLFSYKQNSNVSLIKIKLINLW